MDTNGILAGVLVVSHRKPYGEFSVDRPEFAAQFRGKSIRDPFRLGEDVDAVSRATITMGSATRAHPQHCSAYRPAAAVGAGGGRVR